MFCSCFLNPVDLDWKFEQKETKIAKTGCDKFSQVFVVFVVFCSDLSVFSRGEEMAEKTAGDEEDDAGGST